MTTDAARAANPWNWWPSLAPGQLTQSINPGWVFGGVVNVTHVNSAAPEVERAVVEKYSYGRQIGRLMDAVSALAANAPAVAADERITEFQALAREVDKIKDRARMSSADRLCAEIEELRDTDPAGFRRLRKLLAG